MTRRPKTPRTKRQAWKAGVDQWDWIEFGTPIPERFRRHPKGRRAKSGAAKKPLPASPASQLERLRAAIAGVMDDIRDGSLKHQMAQMPEPMRSSAIIGMNTVSERLLEILKAGGAP